MHSDNIKIDQWISRQIGFKAYSLIVDDVFFNALTDSLSPESNWLKEIKTQKCFVYTKIDPGNISRIAFVEKNGFHLVDTNVTFRKDLTCSVVSNLKKSDYAIGFAKPEDKNAAISVARNNFTYSRFHMDSFFSKELADNIKGSWVESYFNGRRGDAMVLAKKNGDVTGFLQLFIKPDHIIIDLIAVDKNHQKQGLAMQMIEYAITQTENIEYAIVGTQLANLPSISLYQKLGFRLIFGTYVFHYHNG